MDYTYHISSGAFYFLYYTTLSDIYILQKAESTLQKII